MIRWHSATAAVVVSLVLCPSPAPAQGRDPGFDGASAAQESAGDGAVVVGTGGPRFPRPLAQLLTSPKPGSTVAFWRWSSLAELGPVRSVADMARDGVSCQIDLVDTLWRMPLPVVRALHLDTGNVEDLWALMTKMSSSRPLRFWVRTSLSANQLASALADAGATELPGCSGVWVEPPRPQQAGSADGNASTTPSAQESPEKARQLLRRRYRFAVLQGGWLEVFLPLEKVADRLCKGKAPPTVGIRAEALTWPMSELLDAGPATLSVWASMAKKNDEEGAGDGPEATRKRLERRLRELRAADSSLAGVWGDGVMRFSEGDGGVRLDAAMRHHGGDSEENGQGVFEAVTAVAAMMVSKDSPNLARELRGARIWSDSQKVYGEVVVSQASLVDAVQAVGARQREIESILTQLRDLAAAQR